jgi:hypothetical protein
VVTDSSLQETEVLVVVVTLLAAVSDDRPSSTRGNILFMSIPEVINKTDAKQMQRGSEDVLDVGEIFRLPKGEWDVLEYKSTTVNYSLCLFT